MATATATKKVKLKAGHSMTTPVNPTDSRRHSWPNSNECIHAWAGNRHHEGRSGNIIFRNGVVYSYGNHFPMARHVTTYCGIQTVLVTTRRFSVTTSSHIHATKMACPTDRYYEVPNVLADSPSEHKANVKAMIEEAGRLADKSKRARNNKG